MTDLSAAPRRAILFETLGQLLILFRLKAIIVTLGPHGYVYMNDTGQKINGYQSRPEPLLVVDTVGCGDAFSAIFLVGLQKDWPTELTLRRAHECAGAMCAVRGAVSADMNFYLNWKNQWAAAGHEKK